MWQKHMHTKYIKRLELWGDSASKSLPDLIAGAALIEHCQEQNCTLPLRGLWGHSAESSTFSLQSEVATKSASQERPWGTWLSRGGQRPPGPPAEELIINWRTNYCFRIIGLCFQSPVRPPSSFLNAKDKEIETKSKQGTHTTFSGVSSLLFSREIWFSPMH